MFDLDLGLELANNQVGNWKRRPKNSKNISEVSWEWEAPREPDPHGGEKVHDEGGREHGEGTYCMKSIFM